MNNIFTLGARHTKIIATLGPASNCTETIEAMINYGVDTFRLNFSHGTQEEHRSLHKKIRDLEKIKKTPIGILADLQGTKIRVGKFVDGRAELKEGAEVQLIATSKIGNRENIPIPHPILIGKIKKGNKILLDDGRIRLEAIEIENNKLIARVIVGGLLSDNKGVSVPEVDIGLGSFTDKDNSDLEFVLQLGVDWIALSFVGNANDIRKIKKRVGKDAWLMAKLERHVAIENVDEILSASDGIMVARGDLGVEISPEIVPIVQKKLVDKARAAGKPVVIATQILESMIEAPMPTRAEISDIATAVYSGADAVMLSAESATGKYPTKAVEVMNRVIRSVEGDETWRKEMASFGRLSRHSVPEAICFALKDTSNVLDAGMVVAYTSSGMTALRASRERPWAPILAVTGSKGIARRLTVSWGILPTFSQKNMNNPTELLKEGITKARNTGLIMENDLIVIVGGFPFGIKGNTNLLHITHVN